MERAQAYLQAVQLPGGAFPGAPIVDTVAALRAFPAGPASETVLFTIWLARPDNAEASFTRLAVLAGTPLSDVAAVGAHRAAILRGELGLALGGGGADLLVLSRALLWASREPLAADLVPVLLAALDARVLLSSFSFADNEADPALAAEVAIALRGVPGGESLRAQAVLALTSAASGAITWPAADVALAILATAGDSTLADQLLPRLAALQAPDGSFDGGDVRATALAAQALRLALPDLSTRLPAVGLSEAVTGQPLTQSILVTNGGKAASPATSVSCRVTLAGGMEVHSGTAAVPALAPGQTVAVSLDLGVQGPVGSRQVVAVVNAGEAFAEGGLDNNVLSYGYRVLDLPDLAVEPADITVFPTLPALHGIATVTVRVRNVGEAMARNAHVQLFRSTPGGDVLVSETFLNAVAPGVPRSMRATFTVETLDPVTLTARIDPEGALAEKSRANNSAFTVVHPVSATEVTVDLVARLNLPSSVPQGDTLTIAYGLSAFGYRWGMGYPHPELWPFSGATAVLYEGMPETGLEIARRYFTNVEALFGGSATVSVPTSGWADGTRTYSVVVDPAGLVTETDRANNIATRTVTVTSANLPELWMDGLTADPPVVAPGATFTVRGTLRNTGKTAASNIPVQLTLDGPPVTITVPSLAPGESAPVTQVFTAPTTAATRTVSVYIDPAMTIAESSKANNGSSTQVKVLGADLEIVSVVVAPDPVPVNDQATLTVQVRNVGVRTAAYLSLRAEIPNGLAAPQLIGSLDSYAYPAPSASAEYSIPIATRTLVGDAVARLTATPYSGAAVTKDFTLRALNPDFGVSEAAISFAPANPAPGDVVAPRIVVNNTGALTAPTSIRIYRGYREMNDLVGSGSLTVVAGGSAVFVGPNFTLPANPPYVVTVVLDEENAFVEPNETNNLALRNVIKGSGELVVAFDETHEPFLSPYGATGGWVGGYPDWAKDLAARGYTVRSIEPGSGLTASGLLGVDVVVEALPMLAYNATESAILTSFLQGGGGLLYLGDWGSDAAPPVWQKPQDAFLQILGVEAAHLQLGSEYPNFQRNQPAYGLLADHPITAGLTRVQGNKVGAYTRLPAGAQPVLASGGYDARNLPVAAAFGMGNGRVVVIADTQFFDSASLGCPGSNCSVLNYTPDNARLGMQTIDWLVGRGSDATYAPDLAFAPAAIQTASPTATEGDVVPLSLTVRNLGGNTAGETVVRLYDGPKGARLLTEWSVPALGVDQEAMLTFSWDTTGQSGEHLLTAVIDPDGALSEIQKDNNTVSLVLTASSRADLRIDPSDISVRSGFPHLVQVRVHNQGVQQVPAGGTLRLVRRSGSVDFPGASAQLPAIPPRGAVTVDVPWVGEFPQDAFDLVVSVQPPQGTLDCDTFNDSAAVRYEPPRLEVAAPLPGTAWGGVKALRWAASSETRPAVMVSATIGPAGGEPTGICAAATGCDLDTRTLANGDYLLRVTASDGLQSSIREIPLRVDNASLAVRAFGSGSGTASVTVPATGGTTTMRIPVASRVQSASLLLDAVGASSTTISATPSYDSSGGDLLRYRGRLHYFYLLNNAIQWQVSSDEGATWTAPFQLTPAGTRVSARKVAANAHGLHLVYQLASSPFSVHYSRSSDGTAFDPAQQIGAATGQLSFDFQATEEGLSFVGSYFGLYLAWAGPDGQGWTPLANVNAIQSYYVLAAVAGGRLHLVHGGGGGEAISYRSIGLGEAAGQLATARAAVVSDSNSTSTASPRRVAVAGGAVNVLYDYYGPPQQARLQRCPLARDCSLRDSWLPEPIGLSEVAGTSLSVLGPRDAGSIQAVFNTSTGFTTAHGLDGGRSWTGTYPANIGVLTYSSWLFEPGIISRAGSYSTTAFARFPQLTPRDVSLNVGADGAVEIAVAGMPGMPVQSDGLAAALNAYLAAHADGDDGAVDGFIAVPLVVTGTGAGSTVLRNLEVRYQPLAGIAGLATPPLFSPGGSPGVLDTTALSVLAAGDISVLSATGTVLRTLSATAASGRYLAIFDGRGDGGSVLPSGPYTFGKPGSPVGAIEIDDIAPTAALEASAEGLHGGVVELHGVATDADWAGSAKNFAAYRLEYTTDGTTWRTIATGSSPVSGGVLGRWDTSQVGASSATLRLTVLDRAGNSAVDSRTVGVSPGAPMAPVITGPTVAATPLDSLSSTLTVSGTAEAGTTVTVFRNETAVGTASSDGRWSLAGVALPAGISTFTASATRSAVESARSQAIRVARYALDISVSAPARSPAGSRFTATVTVRRTSVASSPVRIALDGSDTAGHAVALVFDPAVTDLSLPADGSASFDVQVDSAQVSPGDYRLRASAVGGALLPASGEAAVTLDPLLQVAATLSSDRAEYDALQLVALTARLAGTGTGVVGPLQATISVMDPGGRLTILGPFSIASVAPGGLVAIGALYGTPPLPVGAYAADLEVRDLGSQVVAAASAAFTVAPANGTGALSGTLLVNPSTYVRGETVQAAFTVTNRGGDASVSTEVLLLSQATSAVVARSTGTLVVASGATAPGSAALSTTAADGKNLVAVLVGNGRALAAQAVAAAFFQDLNPPVITISGFEDGEVRAGPVTPVVTIADESPFTSSIQLNSAPFTSGTQVTADGDYSLSVSAEDAWHNSSSVSRTFAIDSLAPDIHVTGISANEYRAAAVSPSIAVSDAHLRDSTILLDGQPFTSGTSVSVEGPHLLTAQASDRANNASSVTVPFTIDTLPPRISIAGVADGDLTRLTVAPVVQVTEENPDSTTTLLDGVTWLGLPVSEEGNHVLSVVALDLAGNRAETSVHFATDRTPPLLAVLGVGEGLLYAAPVTPVATATDAHPGTPAWTATLNGIPWAGGTVSSDGDWTLQVAATDAVGNAATPLVVHFAIDATPPRVTVSGVTDGQVSKDALRPVIAVQDAHAVTVDARLDGAAFVSGTQVTAEGDHVLVVNARDAAGNAAAPVTIRFARDTVPPVVTITGVAQGATYYGAVTPSWTVSDAHPGSATATLDGAPFTAGTAVSATGTHTLVVSANDLAGNTASSTVTFQIQPVQASVAAAVDSGSPRVLVVVNCAGQPASCADTQAKVLKAALSGAGITYDIALDGPTFLTKLRENRHNVRVVYRAGSSATNAYWELRELTFEGGGLVVVNDASPDSDPKLIDTLGAAMGGKITTVGTVTITAPDLGPARTLSVAGSGIAQTLKATTALAVGKASKGTVATTNRYGKGRAVTLTLNPEGNDNAGMKDLLVQAMQFAAGGAALAGVPGVPQYVRIQSALASPAGPLDFRLDVWTATGLTPLSDAGQPVVPPRTWTFSLTSAKPEVRSFGVVSGLKGTYPVLAELNLLTGGARLVAQGSVDVVVVGSIAELKQAAITATQAIPAGVNDAAKSAVLAHLNAVNPTPTTKTTCATSIDQTLQATDDLKLITGTAAEDARVKVDRLLRALQALYTTLP